MARLLELRHIPDELDPQHFIYLLCMLHQDSVLLHFLFYLHTLFSRLGAPSAFKRYHKQRKSVWDRLGRSIFVWICTVCSTFIYIHVLAMYSSHTAPYRRKSLNSKLHFALPVNSASTKWII